MFTENKSLVEFDESIESSGEALDESKKIFYRAIKNHEEAFEVCKRLVQDNNERNDRNAKIAGRLNDEQPYSQSKLDANDEGWRSNASSGFLSSLLKKAVPAYKKVVDGAKTLTLSALDNDTSAEGEEKSDIFQGAITKLIRRWAGWGDLIESIVCEEVGFGMAATVKSDEIDWRPIFCRTDEIFFPEQCPQQADKVPLFMYKYSYPLYELAEKLADKDLYKAAGWNVDNIAQLLNTTEDSKALGTSEDARVLEDIVRNNAIGASFVKKAARSVPCYHLFVQETNKRISHWVVDAKDGKEVFVRIDRFERMNDVLALFTLEIGNGKLHGSKGLGRLLYNRALTIERARNLAMDNIFLSGLLVLQTVASNATTAAVGVMHPFMIIAKDYEVAQKQFQPNVEAFFKLDQYNVQLAELQVGALMPSADSIDLADSSAAAVNLMASVEQQVREGILLRFWNQVQFLVWQMQKSICSEENILKAAELKEKQDPKKKRLTQRMLNFIKRIKRGLSGQQYFEKQESIESFLGNAYDVDAIDTLITMMQKGLTPEEIFELSQCPPQQATEDLSERNAQLIDQLAAKYRGDPAINQQILRQEDISSKLGFSAAKRWVILEEDPTLQIEGTRQQLEELTVMLAGDAMPVSPRDNDLIHLQVLMQKGQQMFPQLQNMSLPPNVIGNLKFVLDHANQHIQSAEQKGMKGEMLDQAKQFVQMATQLLSKVPPMQMRPPALPPGVRVPNIQDPLQNGGSVVQSDEIPLNPPTPLNPAVEGSSQLPTLSSDMTMAEAARQKPFSKSTFNLTPPV